LALWSLQATPASGGRTIGKTIDSRYQFQGFESKPLMALGDIFRKRRQ